MPTVISVATSAASTSPPPSTDSAMIGGLTRRRFGPVIWFMPVAKLSPMSHATISITPWMPNVNMAESIGSPVKFFMPSQVVQPPASDSSRAADPSSARRQFERNVSSTIAQTFGTSLMSAAATPSTRNAIRTQWAA